MKYHNQSWHIPEETARIAKAAFPKRSPFMVMRDEIGILYENSEFSDLFSHQGQPAESPGNLAMVMIMQYAEGLTDKQAVQSVRGRIDWKYALGLCLDDPGFDQSVLVRFRKRLMKEEQEMKLLEHMLALFMQRGWLKTSEQRTDSTHVVAAIRQLNRLEIVGETMRMALSELAVVAPVWLKERITADWFDLYGPRFEEYRLPEQETEREQLQMRIGQDGVTLLQAVYETEAVERGLSELPAVMVLRQVWVQQYYQSEEGLTWRVAKEIPPAEKLIQSPYDVEARYSQKRTTKWTGYKVHLTETCSPKTPHIITHVVTTISTTPDVKVTAEIHGALAKKEMLPKTHYVDTGYVDADNLVQAQQQQIDLLGPTPANTSWQGRDPDAYDVSQFAIDWEHRQAICPQGEESQTWSVSHNAYGHKVIHIRFKKQACASCPSRSRCTTAQTGRSLKIQPREQHAALQLARQRQEMEAFKEQYRRRAGVEGVISQGVRSFHLRTCRYIGLAKTHLQQILIASAINMTRIVCWLQGDKQARTRITPFAALAFNFT